MKLYFINSNGNERMIANCESINDVWMEIDKFLEEHNYKSYYSRLMYEPTINRTTIDVGSHTEEFQVEGNIVKQKWK